MKMLNEMKRFFGKNLKSVKSSVRILSFTILYLLVFFGVFAYFVRYINSLASKEAATSPLQLATIAAALGGLILVGAFYNKEAPLERELRNAAKLLLGAAVSFTVTFLLLEYVSLIKSPTLNFGEWLVVIAAGFAIVTGGITLCLGLVYIIELIRKL